MQYLVKLTNVEWCSKILLATMTVHILGTLVVVSNRLATRRAAPRQDPFPWPIQRFLL